MNKKERRTATKPNIAEGREDKRKERRDQEK